MSNTNPAPSSTRQRGTPKTHQRRLSMRSVYSTFSPRNTSPVVNISSYNVKAAPPKDTINPWNHIFIIPVDCGRSTLPQDWENRTLWNNPSAIKLKDPQRSCVCAGLEWEISINPNHGQNGKYFGLTVSPVSEDGLPDNYRIRFIVSTHVLSYKDGLSVPAFSYQWEKELPKTSLDMDASRTYPRPVPIIEVDSKNTNQSNKSIHKNRPSQQHDRGVSGKWSLSGIDRDSDNDNDNENEDDNFSNINNSLLSITRLSMYIEQLPFSIDDLYKYSCVEYEQGVAMFRLFVEIKCIFERDRTMIGKYHGLMGALLLEEEKKLEKLEKEREHIFQKKNETDQQKFQTEILLKKQMLQLQEQNVQQAQQIKLAKQQMLQLQLLYPREIDDLNEKALENRKEFNRFLEREKCAKEQCRWQLEENEKDIKRIGQQLYELQQKHENLIQEFQQIKTDQDLQTQMQLNENIFSMERRKQRAEREYSININNINNINNNINNNNSSSNVNPLQSPTTRTTTTRKQDPGSNLLIHNGGLLQTEFKKSPI